MKDKKLASIEDFLPEENETNTGSAKKVVLDEREGLIERVDKQFVTQDGRQLLREQY